MSASVVYVDRSTSVPMPVVRVVAVAAQGSAGPTGPAGPGVTGFGADGGYLRSDGTAWVRVQGIAWADLTGVPLTFAPAAHTHAQSDVTGLAASLALLAPLNSPALTGTPTAPTPSAGNNSTRLANTAYVDGAIASLINSAPGVLDTLDELAAALGDDANFASTMTTALAGKQPLDQQLTDLSALSYTGNSLKVVRVNSGETGFELATIAATPPAGSGTEVQYRNGSAFGAITGSSWSGSVLTLPIGIHAASDAGTTTVLRPLKLSRATSGSPAVGIGVGLEFEAQCTAGNKIGAAIEAITTDVASATEDFDLVFSTMINGGALTEMLRLGKGAAAAGSGVEIATGTLYFDDNNGYIQRTAASNTLTFIPSSGSTGMSLANGVVRTQSLLQVGNPLSSAADATVRPPNQGGNSGTGAQLDVLGGTGSTGGTPTRGGHLKLYGGAGGTNQNGGDVYIYGGALNGSGANGNVHLGYSGAANQGRVRVRNSAFYLQGYTSSTSTPTTTDYPADGDFGIHKNTTSGTLYIAYNAAGVIKSVALA